jgi:hypothetical protein
MIKTIGKLVLGVTVVSTMCAGCTLKAEDGSRFSEGIPQGSDVALAVPGSAAGGAQMQSKSGLRIETNGPSGLLAPIPAAGNTAQWYVFTRDLADSVDFGTGVILGAIWVVVHTKPTSVTAHQAVWGPGSGNALDPAVWRLTVNEVATDEYDYELDGRPKDSTSESDYKAVLKGHGWGVGHPNHRSGNFTIDNDAYAALDPLRASKDSGTVKVTFDLRQYPATIEADVHHTADAEFYNVLVTHQKDGSGDVDVNALGDIDTPKDGKLENVVLHSRWDSTGAGRADLEITGGTVTSLGMVKGSECWGSTFQATYYSDTVNYRPTAGDASTCVFPVAAF